MEVSTISGHRQAFVWVGVLIVDRKRRRGYIMAIGD